MEKRSRLSRLMLRPKSTPWGEDTDLRDPLAITRTFARLDKWFGPGCYFGLDVRGWENLPPAPTLLVSNHSGGTSIPDVWGFAVAWYRRFGLTRPCHVLAHEMIFAVEPVARLMSQIGALRASPGAARRVLSELSRDLLVLPGGDLDTWRPWKDRYKVRFSGRTGYIRIALEAGVPVVPVAHAGAHSTLLVLSDGKRFADAIGLKNIARASIFPVHLSVPWGLAIGPMPHIPVPTTLRYRIGLPIPPPPGPFPDPNPDPERVAAYDELVRASIQQMLDALREERRVARRRLVPTRRPGV